jgi:hypothetical protein
MQIGKIAGGVSLLILGAVIAHSVFTPTSAETPTAPAADLSSPLKCNSPEFIGKMQSLFKQQQTRNISRLQEEVRRGGKDAEFLQKQLDTTIHSVLTIVDTTTLGMDGTLTACTMDYNFGLPDTDHTWHFEIGRHDSGEIYWQGAILDAVPYHLDFWQ